MVGRIESPNVATGAVSSTYSFKYRVISKTPSRGIPGVHFRFFKDGSGNELTILGWSQADYLSGLNFNRVILHKVTSILLKHF